MFSVFAILKCYSLIRKEIRGGYPSINFQIYPHLQLHYLYKESSRLRKTVSIGHIRRDSLNFKRAGNVTKSWSASIWYVSVFYLTNLVHLKEYHTSGSKTLIFSMIPHNARKYSISFLKDSNWNHCLPRLRPGLSRHSSSFLNYTQKKWKMRKIKI